MKYLLGILVLSIIIIIHEFGHFAFAKISGVKVIEFSIGVGPRLVKFTRKGTMYSIKALLFGGSCRMLGDEEGENSEGSFNSVSIWKRIAIIAAGPLFNVFLAFVFSVILIGKLGYDPVMVGSMAKGSAAYEAGLRPGDTIIEINGKKMNFYGDYNLYMYYHDGTTLDIKYKRDGKIYNTTVTPEHVEKTGYQIGIYYIPNNTRVEKVNKDIISYTEQLSEKIKNITIFNNSEDSAVEIKGGFLKDLKTAAFVASPQFKVGIRGGEVIFKCSNISKNSPASKAGLMANDRIVCVNGKVIKEYSDLSKCFEENGANATSLTILRNNEIIDLNVVPDAIEQNYYDYGFYLADVRVKVSPAKTVGMSFKQTGYWVKATVKSLGMLISGHVKMDDMAGPVGIVSALGDVVDESKSDGTLYVILNLMNWCIMISANLGIMNLLPIPALDGGRLVFLFIEAFRGKPVPREKEGMVHFIGIIALLILTVVILFNDISKFFR